MTIKVLDEDGTTVHEFPDGSTPEQMQAALTGAKEPSNLDTALGLGGAALHGAARALLAVGSAPLDMSNMVRPGTFAGSEQLQPMLNPILHKPQGTGEEYASAAGAGAVSALSRNPAAILGGATGGLAGEGLSRLFPDSPNLGRYAGNVAGALLSPFGGIGMGALKSTPLVGGAIDPLIAKAKSLFIPKDTSSGRLPTAEELLAMKNSGVYPNHQLNKLAKALQDQEFGKAFAPAQSSIAQQIA